MLKGRQSFLFFKGLRWLVRSTRHQNPTWKWYNFGLKNCSFDPVPQFYFDTLFYFLGPARRTLAVAGGSGHRHQSIIIPAQIGGRQQEKGTIRQLASKPHE